MFVVNVELPSGVIRSTKQMHNMFLNRQAYCYALRPRHYQSYLTEYLLPLSK